ncbi:MAG: insulinase family protein [Clostridiales bacterium]|nr:insulinase family protein [Clostridiales bacterium]MDY4037785.1 insulinase family protein [Candidatus Pseudoscilispira sp.]
METIRRRLMPGVYLTYIQERKFKTNLLSAQLVSPLRRETASANALLPAVLRRGTSCYPDMERFSQVLDELYGARIDCTVRKKGENQCVGFVASFIDDHFLPGGEPLLEPVAELLGDLVCNPATRNGRFFPEYVKGERTNLVDQIRGQVNDKRTYAAIRLVGEMCRGEAYGVGRLGSEEEAKKLSPSRLHKRYSTLLSSARLELFYCGSAELPRVEHALLAAFSALPRAEVLDAVQTMPHPGAGEAHYVTEEMDVSQGKLAIGLSCESRDYPALLLFNMIYGGSATSKLFLNVREKESLCYYASSVLHRQKNIITLSSGIEVENYERAFDEIMAQLAAAQRGEIEDWEENGARSTMRHVLRTMGDSLSQLEDFYLGQAVTGTTDTVESLAVDLDAVTRERMLEAAAGIRLDTVYFLRSSGSAAEESAVQGAEEKEEEL